jgi:hypothetical protein
MANKRISELPEAATLQDSDLLAVVQDTGLETETRKVTVGALRSAIGGEVQPNASQNQDVVHSQSNGFVENFPLSMSEGGQSISVGFYGVRFTPGQNFVVQYAQVCKRDNMTSGSFVVALYSAGITSGSSSRTEGMELLAQSNAVSFSGSNGIAIAEFSEEEQILVEANKEYYMVLYVQHPSNKARGLICRRLFSNDWGNSSLTLAFNGSSQTVLSTLGNSDFSTVYPSSNVNAIVLPYMKIYGQAEHTNTNTNNSRVLVINDANAHLYFTSIDNTPYNRYLSIPDEYSIFVIETTTAYHVVKIRPQGGHEFKDYKKIMLMGNIELWNGNVGGDTSFLDNSGDYRISRYWYSHRQGNYVIQEAFAEFILKNKVWYSVFY